MTMVKYASTIQDAEKLAEQMRHDEPEFANNVKIETTNSEYAIILDNEMYLEKHGKYIIHNKTE